MIYSPLTLVLVRDEGHENRAVWGFAAWQRALQPCSLPSSRSPQSQPCTQQVIPAPGAAQHRHGQAPLQRSQMMQRITVMPSERAPRVSKGVTALSSSCWGEQPNQGFVHSHFPRTRPPCSLLNKSHCQKSLLNEDFRRTFMSNSLTYKQKFGKKKLIEPQETVHLCGEHKS